MDANRYSGKMKKAFHHKSRTGCQRCKARRVKCDERRPVCGNCDRCNLQPCIYDDLFQLCTPEPVKRERVSSQNTNLSASCVRLNSDPCADMVLNTGSHGIYSRTVPRSSYRHLLELRLLHTWMVYSSNPFQLPKEVAASRWPSVLPQLALEYENLRYLMFASAASYLVQHVPDNLEALNAQRTYMCLALQAQRRAVDELTAENADVMFFAAIMFTVRSFTDLWNRPLEPYSPPTQWLYVGRGGGAIMQAARNMLQNHQQTSKSQSNVKKITDFQSMSNRNNQLNGDNCMLYSHLLLPCEDLRDIKILEAYKGTIDILRSIKAAIVKGERHHVLIKPLVSFPSSMPTMFADLVEEKRPRALVILAHYFALLAQAQLNLWWVGDIPEREIRAIQKFLPPEWQKLMVEPLAVFGRTPV